MLIKVWEIVLRFWDVLGDMAPYLLFGFFMAGVLSVMIKAETVERHLGGRGIWPVFKASAFGVPLPLCSCGVIPVAASLRKHGASRGATTSFLISTPQTGVDSVFVTFSLLGPVVAIFRPLAAFLSGIIGGAAVSLSHDTDKPGSGEDAKCEDECCNGDESKGKLSRIFRYGFVTLPRDISRSLIVGLAIAGTIAVFVPKDFFAGTLGQGLAGILVLMALGIPIYVCATASVPVVAALILKGASPGAGIAFLMTGPATNAATIATVWNVMGKKTAIIYLATVALSALGSGLLLDAVVGSIGTGKEMVAGIMFPMPVKVAAGIVLLGVLAPGLYASFRKRRSRERSPGKREQPEVLEIRGMTCEHCAGTVRRAIAESAGVQAAEVNLASGTAEVRGQGYDIVAIRNSIEELGYKVTIRKTAGE